MEIQYILDMADRQSDGPVRQWQTGDGPQGTTPPTRPQHGAPPDGPEPSLWRQTGQRSGHAGRRAGQTGRADGPGPGHDLSLVMVRRRTRGMPRQPGPGGGGRSPEDSQTVLPVKFVVQRPLYPIKNFGFLTLTPAFKGPKGQKGHPYQVV